MESLVLELQREAYKQDSSIVDLVRKTYVLARKLNVLELIEWTNAELKGYKDEEAVPEYRTVYGHLKAFNPYRGYISAYFPQLKDINHRVIPTPISEIEQLSIKESGGKNSVIYTFIPEYQVKLMEWSNTKFEFTIHVPKSEYGKIIDNVRNIILEWTLKLEEEGVIGENMTFNDKEKEVANQIPTITIIGTMVKSQLQQQSNNSTQSLSVGEFKVEGLKEIVEQGNLLLKEITDTEVKAELQADLTVLETQFTSPKPKNVIIKESLASIRNIAEGITGSLLATGIVEKIIPLLAKL